MEDLHKNDPNCGNMPGYTGLWLAADEEIASDSLVAANKRSVTFLSGGKWGRVEGRGIDVSSAFSEGSYTLEITCTLQGTRTGVEARLRDMTRQRFLAKLRDRNGTSWVAGTKSEPLNFDYEHTGDSETTGQHLYQIRIFRETTEPLYLLQ